MTAPAPTHDSTLAINGVGLYVEERGSGAPIVCIHGAGGTTLAWTGAIDRLSRLGRVIAYDRRGCARSERPAHYERTSIAEHADDAAALIDALGAAPAVSSAAATGPPWRPISRCATPIACARSCCSRATRRASRHRRSPPTWTG